MPKEIHPFAVIRRPIITEKSTDLAERHQYVFEVDPRANKMQIKEAVEIGFRVVVVDHWSGLLTHERFPMAASLVDATPEALLGRLDLRGDTFAVVMTHHYADDREYLRALLDTSVAYIGILGPRQRFENDNGVAHD